VDMSEYRDWLFRGLSEEQINDMRQWAWDNYKPGGDVKKYWHPIVRRECERINRGSDTEDASRNRQAKSSSG
jgi:hypothetical protein